MTDFAWSGSVAPWKQIQEEVRHRCVIEPLQPLPRFVVGADCAFSKDKQFIKAAAVVYDRVDRQVIETRSTLLPVETPYVPGYLSFREAPAILKAIEAIRSPFQAILFDGQGLAHPRRCGLATHIGVLLDLPSVGCAKSRLLGTHEEPKPEPGSTAPLWDREEQIGVVLRTRAAVRPLFVSIGHRVDLPTAVELVLACCTRYRLPEPTRVADAVSKIR